jgi:putative glutamine amidotransferase
LVDLVKGIDGLILQGGADVCPRSYGEEPLKPEWEGDSVRDSYELEMIRVAMDLNVPILGICRGLQVINVALGGSLYQDISTQHEGALVHRDWEVYDQNFHEVQLIENSQLARLYAGKIHGKINSVHHQAIKALGQGLIVEAVSPKDGIIEAVRFHDEGVNPRLVLAVQWHPEFQDRSDTDLLATEPLLEFFLDEVSKRLKS